MNLLEKIEAALDSATPPMSDLLRECAAYVRAAGECEELLLIAHMDGYYKGKQDGQKVPDGMQLVPINPTEKMILANGIGPNQQAQDYLNEDAIKTLEAMFKATRGGS